MSIKMLLRTFFAFAMIIVSINAFALPSYEDVLVVVNDKSPQSLEIGDYFKNARKIPDVNICHISVTDLQANGYENGNMALAERNAAIAAVKKYLTDNNLTDKINYIVLTRGIPYFSQNDPSGSTSYQIFDLKLLFELSESAATSSIPDVFTYNKYYYYMTNNYNSQTDYKFAQKKYGYYIVARLDGPGTVNIKKMIDSTGYPAYQSYKSPIKFLTMTPFFSSYPSIGTEIKTRGNIKIVTPDLKNGEDMRDVGQNIMFSYLNRVNFSYPAVSGSTEYFAPYYGSTFYADSDVFLQYPNIYTGLTFLPGSLITCFRSFPARFNHRFYGGLFKFDPGASKFTEYQKKDGSDMKFRHMSCVEYDPVNNWLWCGTGDNPLGVTKSYTDANVSDATYHKYESRRGGGIAIYDKDGNILNHLNQDNSPLLNNRVTKIVYDKYDNRMWVAHYGGIQYYDLAAKTWSEIPEFKNDFAAAGNIYIDPYDTDKVYFSFYYPYAGFKTQCCSLLPGADTSIFEYSKSAKTVKSHVIDSSANIGILPLMAKISADTAWISKYIYYLYRYDLKTDTVLEKIKISDLIPEIATLATGDTYYLKTVSAMTAIPGTKTVLVAVSCVYTYKGKSAITKNYILRITDNGTSSSTLELAPSDSLNMPGENIIWALKVDPNDSNTLYMTYSFLESLLLKSTDQGKTWTGISAVNGYTVRNLREIAIAPSGIIYGVRGYQYDQQNFSDFIAFGACAFGGGLSHDTFTYNPAPAKAPAGGTVTAGAYSSNTDAENQAYSMMFMMLDGYYTGEARFGIFKQYPTSGGGGYIAHMLCFEPKCAPYAPRVDEENLTALIQNKNTIEIPLKSPGLPLAMDGFMAATINNDTIGVKDNADAPVAVTVEYKSAGNKIVLTGDFSGTAYKVTLKCGVNGIKNIKGACLVNTRADEFKDEITYMFGVSTEIYTPPADVTGPVKMPASSSRSDIVTNRVWWTTAPAIGQPLKVNFEISNIGTVKTAAGNGNQKAKIYLNNVLIDVQSYDDITAKGKITLTTTIPGTSVTGGSLNRILVWADATDKVAEIRETNNTNSASFIIETRPDLIVKEITLSPKPKAKAPLAIYFRISNTGAAITAAGAGVQVAAVFVDGKAAGTVTYDDVPKGGSVTKQLALPSGIATAGTHKIKVVADTNNAVNEINETNNSLEKNFLIAK